MKEPIKMKKQKDQRKTQMIKKVFDFDDILETPKPKDKIIVKYNETIYFKNPKENEKRNNEVIIDINNKDSFYNKVISDVKNIKPSPAVENKKQTPIELLRKGKQNQKRVQNSPYFSNNDNGENYYYNNAKLQQNSQSTPVFQNSPKNNFRQPSRKTPNNSLKKSESISKESPVILSILCMNCGNSIPVDEIEEHSKFCTKVSEEIIKNESNHYEVYHINYKLKKLGEHVESYTQPDSKLPKNLEKEIKCISTLLSQYINDTLNIEQISTKTFQNLKKIFQNVDNLAKPNFNISTLILIDRAKVLISEKVKIFRDFLKLQVNTKKENDKKTGTLRYEEALKEKKKQLERITMENELEKIKVKNLRKSASPLSKPDYLKNIVYEANQNKNKKGQNNMYNNGPINGDQLGNYYSLNQINDSPYYQQEDDIDNEVKVNLVKKFSDNMGDRRNTTANPKINPFNVDSLFSNQLINNEENEYSNQMKNAAGKKPQNKIETNSQSTDDNTQIPKDKMNNTFSQPFYRNKNLLQNEEQEDQFYTKNLDNNIPAQRSRNVKKNEKRIQNYQEEEEVENEQLRNRKQFSQKDKEKLENAKRKAKEEEERRKTEEINKKAELIKRKAEEEKRKAEEAKRKDELKKAEAEKNKAKRESVLKKDSGQKSNYSYSNEDEIINNNSDTQSPERITPIPSNKKYTRTIPDRISYSDTKTIQKSKEKEFESDKEIDFNEDEIFQEHNNNKNIQEQKVGEIISDVENNNQSMSFNTSVSNLSFNREEEFKNDGFGFPRNSNNNLSQTNFLGLQNNNDVNLNFGTFNSDVRMNKQLFFSIVFKTKFEKLHGTHPGQKINPSMIFKECIRLNVPKEKWEGFIFSELNNPLKYNALKKKKKGGMFSRGPTMGVIIEEN